MIFVTGGAGFIGSNFVWNCIRETTETIIDIDSLTYAGNLLNFKRLEDNARHHLIRQDINNTPAMTHLLNRYRPRAIIHFAAESHVDRSIKSPRSFIESNILGTFSLLEAAREFWAGLNESDQRNFRFLHVSTDEVYGSLGPDEAGFSETSNYKPNSPYSASKASSDHLVRAWSKTFGFPAITTHCSNNYGPYQFPEKLIPHMLVNAIGGRPLPVYGDGLHRRDWIYVEDHCEALRIVLQSGALGETYNIGGDNEVPNLDVVNTICDILDELQPKSQGSYRNQIEFVTDRPGHDRRYAIDSGRMEREFGWRPSETFSTGLRKTVHWYLENWDWVEETMSGRYRELTEAVVTGEAE